MNARQRLQCKDIDTDAILRFLAQHQGEWCNWYFGDAKDVRQSMPKDTPEKLALAKMRQLIRAGLVTGCGCSCRGDFEITDKGLDRVGIKRTREPIG
jgi:hypothetical protein